MVSWFWEVGGMMRARAMIPSASISYWCKSSPRGASVAPVPTPAARATTLAAGGRGRLVALDEAQRLVAGEDQLDRAHDDAPKGVRADLAEPGVARGLAQRARAAVARSSA